MLEPLVWLVTIWLPTVSYDDPYVTLVAGTVMVTVRAVIGAVEVKRTSSSSNHGLFAEGVPLKVAGPPLVLAAVMVSGKTSDLLKDPLVPVTVTLLVPTVAVLAAVRERVLAVDVVAGLKLAVTPLGRPLTLNATLPLNPPDGLTETVVLPAEPAGRESVPEPSVNANDGGAPVEPGLKTTVVSE